MSAITLTYGATTITLRPPEFENVQSVSLSRVNRKTRNGDLIVFRDSNWSKAEILKLQFRYLSTKQSQDLLYFIQISLGQDVTFIDYEGRTFVGTIITPAGNISQPGIQDIGAEIEFQLNQDQIDSYGS